MFTAKPRIFYRGVEAKAGGSSHHFARASAEILGRIQGRWTCRVDARCATREEVRSRQYGIRRAVGVLCGLEEVEVVVAEKARAAGA